MDCESNVLARAKAAIHRPCSFAFFFFNRTYISLFLPPCIDRINQFRGGGPCPNLQGFRFRSIFLLLLIMIMIVTIVIITIVIISSSIIITLLRLIIIIISITLLLLIIIIISVSFLSSIDSFLYAPKLK